jgi:NAD(P)H-nitrite reductase large subunit
MHKHVIIGGGPAATNAVETIRQLEKESSEITLVSDEPAHSRMALPYWLAGKIPREQTYTGDDQYFQTLNVDTCFGTRVTKIDPHGNRITLDDGSSQQFDTLLIATGASPRRLDIPGADLPGVQPLWSLAHTASALQTVDGVDQPRAVLIGAGFVGFIVLNAMFKRGWRLAVVEQQAQVLPRMLDADSAMIVQDWLGSKHVDVNTGTTVKQIRQAGDGAKVIELDNGQQLVADLVIMAVGIAANLSLLDGAGIRTDEGILVNDRLQTNFPHIYAGGDVAQGRVMFSDRPEIHAIQPTAVDHGRVAGANMAGQDVRYDGSLLMNVVDVCGLQCASFGNWGDASADVSTVSNPGGFIYRKLLWTDDRVTGAIFTGRANDLGMLTDVGMVKGMLQTQSPLGEWKGFLQKNSFDIRRAYIGAGVARHLIGSTVLGRPAQPRDFHFGDAKRQTRMGHAHAAYMATRR